MNPDPATAALIERLDRISTQVDSIANELRARVDAQREWTELAQELNSLGGAGMARLTDVLSVAEEKGYFAFARQGALIADHVVTEFTEDDVRALGDNIVTILNAVKEMTQPEVMGLLRRTALTVQDAEDVRTEPPSLFALLKSMRDPQTRRGLARLLSMLRTVGEKDPPTGPGSTERN